MLSIKIIIIIIVIITVIVVTIIATTTTITIVTSTQVSAVEAPAVALLLPLRAETAALLAVGRAEMQRPDKQILRLSGDSYSDWFIIYLFFH